MEFQYKEMGTRIKVRRKELKIKQAELAEALEISNNHMSSIENGRQKPSLDTFIGICRCLNVTPDYLLLGTMHAYNIPQDISDKLRLCNQSDIELAKDFIELLVKRNSTNKTAICFHNFAFLAFLAFYAGISLTFFHFLTSAQNPLKNVFSYSFFVFS